MILILTIGSNRGINDETPRWDNSGGASNHNEIAPRMASDKHNTIILTFKYRLLPTAKQHLVLKHILEQQRLLYNGALEHRIGAYRKAKKITLYSQITELTILRQIEDYAAIPANLQRWTLVRLDEAYKGFFLRVKMKGEKAGFPRFRSAGRWNSFGFAEFSGISLKRKRLYFRGMPSGLRMHLHRLLPEGKPLCCSFTHDHKGWYICLQYRLASQVLPATGKQVGVDMGLKELAILSTGESIPNPRVAKRAERERRRRERSLARCRKGSKRRTKVRLELTRLHARIRNTRSTHLHQVSARLVRENDLIAVENLNVRGLAAGMLAKPVHDAAWARLKQLLTYKAEWAGRQLIEVDPRNTTQACSGCGSIVPKTLKERWHSCPHCGLELDRDHNAALNVLHRAVLRPGLGNVAECRMRSAGNIVLSARAK